jgi:hypothetical protein
MWLNCELWSECVWDSQTRLTVTSSPVSTWMFLIRELNRFVLQVPTIHQHQLPPSVGRGCRHHHITALSLGYCCCSTRRVAQSRCTAQELTAEVVRRPPRVLSHSWYLMLTGHTVGRSRDHRCTNIEAWFTIVSIVLIRLGSPSVSMLYNHKLWLP